MNYDTLVGIVCILASISFTRIIVDICNALYRRYTRKWFRSKWEKFFIKSYETLTGRYE